MRIVHLTSVHSHGDVRIHVKMCRSLAKAGYEVHLIAPGHCETKNELRMEGVFHHYVPKSVRRYGRVTSTAREIIKIAVGLDADIYHFHDPELMLWVGKLRRRTGAKIVYDVHEDVRLQILQKKWLPRGTRMFVSKLYGAAERVLAPGLAGVIAATPSIGKRYEKLSNAVVIQNYPISDELQRGRASWRGDKCIYAGGIEEDRGILQIVDALSVAGEHIKMDLLGEWYPKVLQNVVSKKQGWQQIDYHGMVSRDTMAGMMSNAFAGLVLFLPKKNHIKSQPNKLFEYMSAGLPVIASDFPAWRDIVEKNNCGVLVDPNDVNSIAGAMRYLHDNRDVAQEMGLRGKDAVASHYNWESEFKKLVEFYDEVKAS